MKNLVCLVLVANTGCLATLPDPAYVNDSQVFSSNPTNYEEAKSCGTELNRLRSTAKWENYGRVGVTGAAGITTAVSSFIAATKDKEDDTKTEAYIALGSGIIAVLAQLIPDPTSPLDEHRKGSTSWNEARLRAARGVNDPTVFQLLQDCRKHKAYEPASQGGPRL